MKPFQLIDRTNGGSIKNDLLSGITVALALVPEAVAFAFVAGISPIVGLYGAFMMGLVTAIFGGRPGMISGATGAMAVVMVSLVSQGNELGGYRERWSTVSICYPTTGRTHSGFCWCVAPRKICTNDTTFGDDGVCQWLGHCHLPFTIGDV